MSVSLRRYNKVLESIPCYPESVSSLEIRQQLLSSDLLPMTTDEKSQLRTVQRCINQVVADNSSIEINDECRPYRYQIARGHRHPIKPDGMSSVVSLQVIEQEIKSMLPPTLRSDVDAIFSSLKQQDTKQTRLWNERFCYFPNELPLIAPNVGSAYFKLIEEALLNKKDLHFSYQKRGATEAKDYTSTPLGLFLYGNSFYFVGLVPGSDSDIRTYALHRIHSLKLGFSSVRTLANFDVRKHVQRHARHFAGGDKLSVTLRIENYSGLHLIEETLLSEDQVIVSNQDGFTTISATVRDSHTLEWWLMKHANIVEVITPSTLREKVVEMIEASVRLYGL
ncbi:helix-turn-helix transcriptional regulator [Vibrio agarivorans]|uniref:WYL domain-containing protein n=1 Tax=Vibrio agarivorans TaxID=153622 RepID=A0ABT7Y617_9VIBR|nr:WYL domain-containing protein [Vibrio agarivorans]MDN2483452.1 WYL domain-containing protein [Vibrio agarivorans]